jgi:hypothetical protein
MRELTMQCLEARQRAFDEAVQCTPDIDRFCSSSYWVLPAWSAFLPEHRLWARETEFGFILLGIGTDHSLGTYVHPLEASWALASPFVGRDVAALTRQFVSLSRDPTLNWDILFLSGISPDSLQFHELIRGFRGHYSLGLGPSSVRRIASLDGGVEGFLSRRSSRFRHNLRRARRRAEETGIQAEMHRTVTADEALALLDRALDVEHRSWKADADTGIIDGPMKVFYRNMLPRLARQDALRFLFLTLDGKDIAYCFGGVFDDTFRGLQMSFDDDYRSHSPGSLAQLLMIEALTTEGLASYDLGSDMEYKRDWAEESMETLAVIVRRI